MEIEDIEKTTVQLLSRSTWNEVADVSEEAAIVVEDVTDHFAHDYDKEGKSLELLVHLKINCRRWYIK